MSLRLPSSLLWQPPPRLRLALLSPATSKSPRWWLSFVRRIVSGPAR